DRQLAGDEVSTARRAARFSVVVREQHAFRRQLIEVRRLSRHDSAMIGADVEPADIVAHDHKYVWTPFLLPSRCHPPHGHGNKRSQQTDPDVLTHASLPPVSAA